MVGINEQYQFRRKQMATPVQGKFIDRTKNPNRKNQYTVVRAISNETLETTGSNNNTAFFADGTGYSIKGAEGGTITGGLTSGSIYPISLSEVSASTLGTITILR
tara:strand:+ start:323 stop:637 length:315 start_codon:yes stop_codon:yes gene_type:complete